MTTGGAKDRSGRPIVLSFLAPADRCNQRCPACVITEVFEEPVRNSDRPEDSVLSPSDFAQFFTEVFESACSVARVSFQGYEVTLPQSWPYLVAVFTMASRCRIDTGFITNGMLLHRRVESIRVLQPRRISVSLDGGDADTNDRLRGLPGAFEATLSSVRRFLSDLPDYAPRITLASCLHDEANARSLTGVPRLARRLGVTRWALSFAIELSGSGPKPVMPLRVLFGWVEELRRLADDEGIHCFVNDELGFLKSGSRGLDGVRHLPEPGLLYRFDPFGYVRRGHEIATRWDSRTARRWEPGRIHAGSLLFARTPTGLGG